MRFVKRNKNIILAKCTVEVERTRISKIEVENMETPTPGTSSGHRVGLSENTRGWIMLSFFSRIWPFVTLWTVAYQAPLYMGVGLDPSIFEYASLPGKVFCETPQHFCDFMQTKTT